MYKLHCQLKLFTGRNKIDWKSYFSFLLLILDSLKAMDSVFTKIINLFDGKRNHVLDRSIVYCSHSRIGNYRVKLIIQEDTVIFVRFLNLKEIYRYFLSCDRFK